MANAVKNLSKTIKELEENPRLKIQLKDKYSMLHVSSLYLTDFQI